MTRGRMCGRWRFWGKMLQGSGVTSWHCDMYDYRVSLDKGLSSPKPPEGLQDRYDCHCYTVIGGMLSYNTLWLHWDLRYIQMMLGCWLSYCLHRQRKESQWVIAERMFQLQYMSMQQWIVETLGERKYGVSINILDFSIWSSWPRKEHAYFRENYKRIYC